LAVNINLNLLIFDIDSSKIVNTTKHPYRPFSIGWSRVNGVLQGGVASDFQK